MYSIEQVYNSTLEYFSGDALATEAWMDKYCLKNNRGEYLELNPNDMHLRLAKEFYRIEQKYPNPMSEESIFNLLKNFKYIIPQGSPMYGIGNDNFITSLSNCFVIGSNKSSDSYGSIMRTDEEQVQLMKRRGGVGHDISHLRPSGSLANNSSLGSNAGSTLYMNRYSNSTREVSQDGRRGALMLSIDCKHPDTEKFIDSKLDTTKITGANISVKISDEFMKCVQGDFDFYQTFPIEKNIDELCENKNDIEYDRLYFGNNGYYKKIKAKKLWDKIIYNAWRSAEPGILFWDKIIEESPADCYGESWRTVSTNPCFTGDTIIAVADGRNGVTIKQLAEEGVNFPVYSARVNSSSGNRKGVWKVEINSAVAFKTGVKEVIKVILSDGSFFECTPDHLLALPNGTYIEAKDSEGEFLEKFYSFSNKNTNKSYRHINTINNGFNRQYRMVWEYFYGSYDGKKFNVDHIDSDSTNDLLNNLRLLDYDYHKSISNRIGEDNPINKMDKDRMKYFQKYKNILGNASRYKWNDERLVSELNKFYSENILPEIKDANIYLNDRVYVDKIIYEGRYIEVYDLNVKNNHNFYIITKTDDERFLNSSGILVHNCGEIPLCSDDSCRLLAINLYSYVKNKFQNDSYFEEELFTQHVVMAQRLMDDLVDLEIEKLDRIINKIILDPEPEDIKQVELNLWKRIRQKAIDGRRTGLGVTGEGDMLAALGLTYGTKEATAFSERIHSLLAINSYASSVLMAKERGSFPIWNLSNENLNPFISRIFNELNNGIGIERGYSNSIVWMYETVGRRNISNLTIAPTGCLDKNVKIKTNKGDISLGSLFELNGINIDDLKGLRNEWFEPIFDVLVFDETGNSNKISKLYWNGVTEGFKLKFSNSSELSSSKVHKFLVKINENQAIWKSAEELNVGDKILKLQ